MTTRTITYDDAEALAYLGQLSARLGDLTPVMQDLGEYLVTSTKGRFGTSTAPDGTPWAANSLTTLALYGRMFKGAAKAVANKQPLIGESKRLSGEIHALATASSVTVGSSMIYAGVQQFGAAKHSLGPVSPWGNIPARPYLGLSATDRGNVLDIVRGYLDGA